MVDSPRSVASHDSGQGTGKAHATKDKQCQYCQQPFTSSSLGRHLDQFIFRKKPDGIHNVDEIRRLRGGITRRTAKGNANSKPDSEGSHLTPHTTSPVTRDSSAGDASRTDLNATPAEGYRIRLNAPNWQSTGVINGLPGSMTASPALENKTFADRKRKYSSIETAAAKDILGLRGDLGSEKDTARALELALREVLDTIRAAQYAVYLHHLNGLVALSNYLCSQGQHNTGPISLRHRHPIPLVPFPRPPPPPSALHPSHVAQPLCNTNLLPRLVSPKPNSSAAPRIPNHSPNHKMEIQPSPIPYTSKPPRPRLVLLPPDRFRRLPQHRSPRPSRPRLHPLHLPPTTPTARDLANRARTRIRPGKAETPGSRRKT